MGHEFSIIIKSTSISFLLCAVLLWLTRTWLSERIKRSIKYEYDSKIELIRTILKLETEQTLERLKADLQLHQIRHSKLIDQRAQVIKQLHEKIDILARNLYSLVKPLQFANEKSIEEKNDEVFQAGKDLEYFYRANMIFFPKNLCDQIVEIQKIMASGEHWFISGYRYSKNPVSSKAAQQYSEWMLKACESFEKKVPPLKEAIEDEFRKLLGV